jgi:hypothetical protein
MPAIPRFIEHYGSGISYAKPAAEDVERWRGRLHDKILEEWTTCGWCSYGDGFVWLVNPAEFEQAMAEWNKKAIVFARTSFGHLLLTVESGETAHLDVHRGDAVNYAYNAYRFLQYALTDNAKFIDVVLDRALHREALQKFGPIASDEMYTFEPALALGGAAELKYVQKVKMSPQLSILAGLNGGT